MQVLTKNKNWVIGITPEILHHIHQPEVNIAIYERAINSFTNEINSLISENIEFRASGTISAIAKAVEQNIDASDYALITQDIRRLLRLFKDISKANNFRLLLATIDSNMCRKFHTDINDLRMLCTYHGPGTLWLTDDNINRRALGSSADNHAIVKDESKVRQAKTGSVVILKGAIYPQEKTSASVHRSPTIETGGVKRLLLRIDTNEFLNF